MESSNLERFNELLRLIAQDKRDLAFHGFVAGLGAGARLFNVKMSKETLEQYRKQAIDYCKALGNLFIHETELNQLLATMYVYPSNHPVSLSARPVGPILDL